MNRMFAFCLLAAILATGCGGDDKPTNTGSTPVPPIGDKFDKKAVPGKTGPKSG